MTSVSYHVFDRRLIRHRRDRAAARAGDFDFLHVAVARQLMERLSMIKRRFPLVVDLGGYHGSMADMLRLSPQVDRVIATDISARMVEKISARGVDCVQADEEFLPFADNTLDAVVCNMSLQWVNDVPGVLTQIMRALKPDGLFLAALPGAGTLGALRESLMAAELAVTGGVSPRVSPFIDLRDMAGLVQRAGFALPVVDGDAMTVVYDNAWKLMQDLRGMAASNAVVNRLKQPTRRTVMMEAARVYHEKYAEADTGRIPARFEMIYAIGWKPDAQQPQPLKPGSAKVRLADALSVTEGKLDDPAKP